MGNRLSKIYTKTGDKAETGLGDGSRVAKTDDRVRAMGSIDEANAHLGMLIDLLPSDLAQLSSQLTALSHRLFDLGGEISIPGYQIIIDRDVTHVEGLIDHYNADLPPLTNFIMPGGNPLVSQAHILRAVTRRAELDVAQLMQNAEVNMAGYQLVNRLSDLWFVLARYLGKHLAVPEKLWQPAQSN